MQPFELTLAAAAQQIKAKVLSPVELTESVLARIAAVNPQINAFSNVTAELAARDAARAEREIAADRYRGALHGIPVGVKEIYDMAGVPSTSSSRVRADHIPDEDSVVVAKVREAGAVVVGRTHSDEFAFGVSTPQTHNPWRPDRIVEGPAAARRRPSPSGRASSGWAATPPAQSASPRRYAAPWGLNRRTAGYLSPASPRWRGHWIMPAR